jgi:hypothetical protein
MQGSWRVSAATMDELCFIMLPIILWWFIVDMFVLVYVSPGELLPGSHPKVLSVGSL